ncbi:MAG TPA: SsrA-binding protein SmpB [Candidatus Megaira endosymbiont of Nemacystus decipiens]|nr:SsrA-binding protein SmpB [Candidatus Megaera endosymbiont of Nemacystus decipiens]
MSEYQKVIAKNKRAYYDYFIEDEMEAGIVLKGSELKSLRNGKASIAESHAGITQNEAFLYNCYIDEYDKANRFNHDYRRPKKLLLHKHEIKKITGKIKQKGYTLVALSIYFNNKNKVKVALGLAKGKKQHDKRESIKEKDWKRQQGRIIRDK